MQFDPLRPKFSMTASSRQISFIRQTDQLGQQFFLMGVKRARQAHGAHPVTNKPSPTNRKFCQLACNRRKFRWEASEESKSRILTSKLCFYRHDATQIRHNINSQPNFAPNTITSAPQSKSHHGHSSLQTSIGIRSEPALSQKMRRRHNIISNTRVTSLPAGETKICSNGISGTRLVNQGLCNVSFQSADKALSCNTMGEVLNSRPSKKPQSSPATQKFQIHGPPLKPWQVQKRALFEKFGSFGWSPRKRVSPDDLEDIRALNSQSPEKYTTPVLAEQFKVSPEAIRRILKSKWRPNEEEQAKRQVRWTNRGKAIWSQMVEIGIKPPKKWRAVGVERNKHDHYHYLHPQYAAQD